jgi:hypothetical protein
LATSFDHLVGACEQRWRHGEVERLAVLTLMSNSNFVLIIDQSVQPITNPIRLTALQRSNRFSVRSIVIFAALALGLADGAIGLDMAFTTNIAESNFRCTQVLAGAGIALAATALTTAKGTRLPR